VPVTTPAALTEAVFVSAELQVTEAVKSLDVPSEKLPVAFSDCVLLTISVAESGVTVRPVSVAEPPPPPPPFDWFFTPLQAASRRANDRTQILRSTVFPSARIDRAKALVSFFGAGPKPTGQRGCSSQKQPAERVALLLSVRNLRDGANGKTVLPFQYDTF